MLKCLVIVESPAKAKTIKKFLGKSYKVEASNGHVRDLPKSQLGVDIENDFEPKYITIRGKGSLLSDLRKEVKKADKVYLATDPDREGEAISWHLLNALKLESKSYSRITFNEITKDAVKNSIKNARDIDMDLVDAQQARRILDRIVGYKISPLLWKKIKKGLSAGRVQSVALSLICEREEEINEFIPEEYWTIDMEFIPENKKGKIDAKFYGYKDEKIKITSKVQADKILHELKNQKFNVSDVKKSERSNNPLPPFITSTLQQEASKKLNFSTQKTMSIAQQLYEGVAIKGKGTIGLITYLRTDSIRISDEAHKNVLSFIKEEYGADYANEKEIKIKTKKNMQDAHEAIRPTYVSYQPLQIKQCLSKEQYKLYNLIWNRFVASRMNPAIYTTYSVKIDTEKYRFTSSGSEILFEGFLKVYKLEDNDSSKIGVLHKLSKGEKVEEKNTDAKQHFTQPPARFTEATLVKKLEENGVGRPSTYSPTITTILKRGYVTKEKKVLYTTEIGEIVNEILNSYFKEIVDVDFTVHLEEQLDKVEDGELEWKEVIRGFYPEFNNLITIAEEKISKIEIKEEVTDVICEKCGKNMVIKMGKFGKFLACPGFPECINAKPYYEEIGVKCPKCSGEVYIKKTKKGRLYYGCENNPECEFMSWNKPTNIKCEICGEMMFEKNRKGTKLICSNEKCGNIVENEDK